MTTPNIDGDSPSGHQPYALSNITYNKWQVVLVAICAVGAFFSISFAVIGIFGFVTIPLSTACWVGANGIMLAISAVINFLILEKKETAVAYPVDVTQVRLATATHSRKIDHQGLIISAFCAIASLFLVLVPIGTCFNFITLAEENIFISEVYSVSLATISGIFAVVAKTSFTADTLSVSLRMG